MKHYRKNLVPDTELYETIDAYDYADFDDDYYFDLVEERVRMKKGKRVAGPSDRYNRAFQKYVNEY